MSQFEILSSPGGVLVLGIAESMIGLYLMLPGTGTARQSTSRSGRECALR